MAKLKLPFTDKRVQLKIPIIDDIKEARSRARQATIDVEVKRIEVANRRQATQDALELLGRTRLDVYDGSLRGFVRQFSRLKAIEATTIPPTESLRATPLQVVELNSIDFQSVDALKALTAAGGAAAVSGSVALGAVGSFAVASTGTAIASLSGAAATNATLAFLGGGSLAVGGGGMALGMAVLGGIIVIPAIFAGGIVLQGKAKKVLEKAKKDEEESNRFLTECNAAIEGLDTIRMRASGIRTFLLVLDERLVLMARALSKLLDRYAYGNPLKRFYYLFKKWVVIALSKFHIRSPRWLRRLSSVDFDRLSSEEKEHVIAVAAVAHLVKMLLDVRIFDDQGLVTDASATVLCQADSYIKRSGGFVMVDL